MQTTSDVPVDLAPGPEALRRERLGSISEPQRWARAAPERVVLTLTFALGLLVCYLRSPWALAHPRLLAEDGAVWFNDAYNSGWLQSLVHPYAGYLVTFPRLVAAVGLLVPPSKLPLLFAAVAVVVQVLPAVVIASRRMSPLIGRRAMRLLLAALYLLLPNSWEINSNLTNTQWHLGLLAALVILASPAMRWWRPFDVAVILLAGLTGPYCLMLTPIALVASVARRSRWSQILAGLMLVTAAVQLAVLLSSPRVHIGSLGATPGLFAEIVGGQVVGGTFLGAHTTSALWAGSLWLRDSALMLAAAAVVVGWTLWHAPLELRLLNLYAALVLASSLLFPLVNPRDPWQNLAVISGGRYWFMPAVAIVADLVWMAGQGLHRPIAWTGCGLLALLVTFGAREDFRYPLRSGAEVGWTTQVRRFEATAPGRTFTFQITPPGWTMVLVKHEGGGRPGS